MERGTQQMVADGTSARLVPLNKDRTHGFPEVFVKTDHQWLNELSSSSKNAQAQRQRHEHHQMRVRVPHGLTAVGLEGQVASEVLIVQAENPGSLSCFSIGYSSKEDWLP